ncbi:FAS1 domain-containing protein [Chlamydoabsidia padenii]|nr:FAS1 domain-containing protein [Chlamydoabsidia padenii]
MLLLFIATLSIILLESPLYAHKTIIDVLEKDNRFESLLGHIRQAQLDSFLNNLETGTLFAPDNDAFTKYDGPEITRDILLYHLLKIDIPGNEFHHQQVLESSLCLDHYLQNNMGQRLLIHRTDSSLGVKSLASFFVNDALLIDTDILVNTQTLIHVVNKVLTPPPMIASSIGSSNAELYQVMDKVGLIDLLKQPHPFTVFYSDQSVLQFFNSVERSYLLSKYGDDDLLHILNYLIIRGDIYTDEFTGEKEYETIGGEILTVSVDKELDVITVNGQPILQKNVLAANGVLHQVETMPVTDKLTFDARKYLYGLKATAFVSLLDEYGLNHYLDPTVTDFTFLAPDDASIDEGSLPDNIKKAWLSYHLVHGQWNRDELLDRQLLASELKTAQLNHKPQQITVYLPETNRVSLSFDNARSYGEPTTINGNVIYRLSNPMNLPYDVFSSIVVDLELSSFIATLYVSGVFDNIKAATGITLFAPTNQAYKTLGLVATYLVHPTGRHDLQTTLKYHAAQALLYDYDLRSSTFNVITLTGQDMLQMGGVNNQGKINVGNNGAIEQTNVLMENGVVHKINTVMIPPSVYLTHRKILVAMDAHRVLDWLNDFPWLNIDKKTIPMVDGDDEDDGDYILLAPTDRAFAQLDELLGNGWEQKDPEAYERLVRLHVIPKRMQQHTSLGGNTQEYGTLLSDHDRVVIQDGEYFDEQFVQVIGQTGKGAYAHVLDKGKLRPFAQVIQLDTVLLPVSRGVFGLPWIWSTLVVSILVLIGISLLAWAIYYIWQRRRRSGYQSIEQQGNPSTYTEAIENHQDL